MSSLPLALKEYKELAHALLFTYMTAHACTHLVRLGGTANDDHDGKTKILSLENIKIYKHLADTWKLVCLNSTLLPLHGGTQRYTGPLYISKRQKKEIQRSVSSVKTKQKQWHNTQTGQTGQTGLEDNAGKHRMTVSLSLLLATYQLLPTDISIIKHQHQYFEIYITPSSIGLFWRGLSEHFGIHKKKNKLQSVHRETRSEKACEQCTQDAEVWLWCKIFSLWTQDFVIICQGQWQQFCSLPNIIIIGGNLPVTKSHHGGNIMLLSHTDHLPPSVHYQHQIRKLVLEKCRSVR